MTAKLKLEAAMRFGFEGEGLQTAVGVASALPAVVARAVSLLPMRMHIRSLIFSVLVAVLAGCSTPHPDSRVGVLASEPHEFMYVAGDGHKAWYSALELEQIARRYAEEKQLAFDFSQAGRMVWVKTDGGRVLADVYFSSEMGKPYLHVAVDRHGRVIRHETGTLVCGTGSK